MLSRQEKIWGMTDSQCEIVRAKIDAGVDPREVRQLIKDLLRKNGF
jgi:hypothetical protein